VSVPLPDFAGDRTRLALGVTAAMGVALCVIMVGSLAVGPAGLSAGELLAAARSSFSRTAETQRPVSEIILMDIRLPRLFVGASVGALLAVAGTMLQGLFRNPLADPGLIGVSGGSSLGAVLAIMYTGVLLPPALAYLSAFMLPMAAFAGGLVTTYLLYRIGTRRGRTSVATMLLAGIALGAIASAATGYLIFSTNDRQLRDITFWSLGSIAGSTWLKAGSLIPFLLLLLGALPFIGRGLNAIVLGEAEARHLGVRVQLLKRAVIVLAAAATGSAVAASGVIGFVGIIVPHLLRLAIGPDHRFLLPASALGGAALLLASDMVARTVVAPAELPIGVVTAAIGAPFFLWILLRRGGFKEF
jgi:iron complex transport system permease protein